ncbi:hypothetical protein GCM10022243_11740 [Saccharothrix violaceirubra]|uniref:Uncharacterized protein n=1 Tax=Saccharothrix violaceirubra TaxID=413306 RepID=A0A7W7WZC8_9PSEU|nr:hypothetical protein [Saccharothrix violaceirubra]MBB4968673.1 hypothetical protein [Saccharothrix violaceirubra]
MTSVGEVKLRLEQGCELLGDVYRCVREAQTALDEALELLAEVDATSGEDLVPAGFVTARERFADELELIVVSQELVRRLSAEL